MNILLIYPSYPATFWSFKYALSFINKKASFPPLGLMTIAAMMPKEWNKKLVDLNIKKLKKQDIEWADMVMISGMIVQKKSAQQVIAQVKALGKPVVAGGPLFTTGHQDFTDVDSFVLDEGEITFPLFLEDWKNGCVKPMYTSKERPDIRKTPVPDWSLIDLNQYSSVCVQFSRGCPFECEFCDIIIMNGRIPRTKTPAQMIAELDAVYESGWRGSVFIVDDNFIGNKRDVKQFLVVLKEWQIRRKYPFSFITETSINLSEDIELMTMMRETNFKNVFVGLESPDPEGLKSCSKYQNVDKDLVESVKTIQRNGMGVWGGFIVGFDTDKPNIFEKMIEFIQKSGVVTAMVGLLMALPQTKLYNRLKEAGRLLFKSSGNNTDTSTNFRPNMNSDLLEKGYKQILKAIFSAKNYYNRIITFFKEYHPFKQIQYAKTKGKIGAFFKSVWRFGILDKGRMYFWKMIFWTLFHKPYLLVEAFTLSVFGYHFRKVMVEANI